MSDLTAPEPTLPELPRADRWIIGTALASVMLHAGVLAFLLWQPLPESAEAPQPPAIDVELVPPPEAASEPPPEEAGEEGAEAEEPAETPPEQPPAADATPTEPPPQEQASEQASAEPAGGTAPPAEAASVTQPPQEPASAPASPAAGAPAQEAPAETEPTEAAASEATAAEAPAASEPAASTAPAQPQGAVVAGKVAPVPLARPRVRGLTAESGSPEEGAAAPADAVEVAEGTVSAATPAEPDVATLELGPQRSAGRFYLEAMLSTPRMAPAREMLKTLPPEKRLSQTCNIEALAQIGNAGEGFTPDVVMAEAYALSEMTATRLVANGAIFRSGEKWFGVAFDCTLSDDLTRVTAFSYRLGADVTEAVLARLNRN